MSRQNLRTGQLSDVEMAATALTARGVKRVDVDAFTTALTQHDFGDGQELFRLKNKVADSAGPNSHELVVNLIDAVLPELKSRPASSAKATPR
ncbi:MAG: hypothetical protein M3N08_05810 [Pseudomonadota bacterium]|nr:hypothetical protein [Pseudomonadota bacterium]